MQEHCGMAEALHRRKGSHSKAWIRRAVLSDVEFYLAYCEGGFHERQLGLAQLILAKPKARQEAPVIPLSLA